MSRLSIPAPPVPLARVVRRRHGGLRRAARRLPRLRRRHRLHSIVSESQPTDDAKLRAYAAELGRRYDPRSGREDGFDRICPRFAGVDPVQRGCRRHPDGRHQGPEGFRRAGRIWQGARRRWSASAGQGCVEPRLHTRQSTLGRHVDPGRGSPTGWAIIRRRCNSTTMHSRSRRASRACSPIWGSRWLWLKKLPDAEQALRQAVATPKADARMRGDLALVLALEGKFGDAETGRPGRSLTRRRARQCRGNSPDDRAERHLA